MLFLVISNVVKAVPAQLADLAASFVSSESLARITFLGVHCSCCNHLHSTMSQFPMCKYNRCSPQLSLVHDKHTGMWQVQDKSQLEYQAGTDQQQEDEPASKQQQDQREAVPDTQMQQDADDDGHEPETADQADDRQHVRPEVSDCIMTRVLQILRKSSCSLCPAALCSWHLAIDFAAAVARAALTIKHAELAVTCRAAICGPVLGRHDLHAIQYFAAFIPRQMQASFAVI